MNPVSLRSVALQDLEAARRGLGRPEKFPPAVVIQLAGSALEGLLADWLDRTDRATSGYSLGHRIRALASAVPVEPSLVQEVTVLGASTAPCGAWDPPSATAGGAQRALALAEKVAELTRSEP